MSVGSEQSIVGGIRIDVRRLHETWMEIVYPRQRGATDTVLGKWKPNTQGQLVLYRAWSALGVPVVALIYPLVLLGTIVRFQTRRIDSTATRLGIVGVIFLSLVVWGTLVALARFRLDLETGGLVAVAAASGVATLSAALAVATGRVGGRATTVLLSYPFAMTAIFLPPVVAALFSNDVASVVVPRSEELSVWFVGTVLDPIGVGEYLTSNFEVEGIAYAMIWSTVSVPLGWLLGLLVTLADLVRPAT